ncbi:GntR family transcriptional regulator [Halalkalibacter flavus]|uniref:GntR family transcriptional regulator n=1 Tax=Halalkalibacter flavus TaxID=3090668 RepID=UPI002FC82EF5
MILDSDSSKPIYVQISEWIEAEILRGHFTTDQKVYSQYQLADRFNINPATAGKGLTLLVEDNILYKKRGLGMFVAEDARERIKNKRKNQTLKKLIFELVLEAEYLDVDEEELVEMIKSIKRKGEVQ